MMFLPRAISSRCVAASTLGVVAFIPSLSLGGFTDILPPAGFEPSHAEILQSFYGGLWAPTVGGNFANGDISATRVDDFGFGGVITAETSGPGSVDDSLWQGGSVFIVPRSGEAMDETYLGIVNGAGDFQAIAPTASNGDLFPIGIDGVSRWVLVNATTNAIMTSNPGDNADGLDHMVAYRITSTSTPLLSRWVIFWEDRLDGELGFDQDYNDAVFEIIAVPSPGALALFATAVGVG